MQDVNLVRGLCKIDLYEEHPAKIAIVVPGLHKQNLSVTLWNCTYALEIIGLPVTMLPHCRSYWRDNDVLVSGHFKYA